MNRRRNVAWIIPLALLTLIQGRSAFAGSTGNSSPHTHQGGAATNANGEYLMSTINQPARYFIEVPPGLARLSVELWDADIGLGGAAEAAAGRDRARGAFLTTATYSLIDPGGTARPVRFTTGTAALPVGADNAWLTLFDGNGNTVLDQFGAAAYNNNNGTANWATNWIKTNDGDRGATTVRSRSSGVSSGSATTGRNAADRARGDLSATGLNLTQAFLTFNLYDFRRSRDRRLGRRSQFRTPAARRGPTSKPSAKDSSRTRPTTSPPPSPTTHGSGSSPAALDATEFFFVDNVQIGEAAGRSRPAIGSCASTRPVSQPTATTSTRSASGPTTATPAPAGRN